MMAIAGMIVAVIIMMAVAIAMPLMPAAVISA
jgi:hypothetical protein